MTPRQQENVLKKIQKIKKALAADKRRWGGFYDDSRGLRYLPPNLFLQLKDYKGAMQYFRWFDKNFPDDGGFPIFLFEWTITLFKNGKTIEAEKKALQTFMSNPYLIYKFLGKEYLNTEIDENSNWQFASLVDGLKFSRDSEELKDFADWISMFISTDKFYKVANEFVDIQRKLLTEPVGQKRSELVDRKYSLLDDYE